MELKKKSFAKHFSKGINFHSFQVLLRKLFLNTHEIFVYCLQKVVVLLSLDS